MCQLLNPTQLIHSVLRDASLSQRIALLLRAKEANQKQLRLLADMRLTCIEHGWGDYWKERHERTAEVLAAIERELAAC